jgi:hypothetical protein
VLPIVDLWPIIRHALAYGVLLSGVLSILLIGTLWVNPEIMLKDYPPDIQAKYGPMSERSRRQRLPVGMLLGSIVLGIVAISFPGVPRNTNGDIPFWAAFVHLFVMFSVFNLVDLLVIDWPIVAMGPGFIVLPGTEGLAGYKDYWFHFHGFLVGTVLIFVTSGLIAGVVATLV